MLTLEEARPGIAKRLKSLGDTSLIQFHNTVNISLSEMLSYVDQFIQAYQMAGADTKEEILILLNTYRGMAERFFTQFEISLLDEIKRQKEIEHQSEQVINKLATMEDSETSPRLLTNDEIKTATHLLNAARDNAASEYTDLIRNFPKLLQTALDKLRTEWQRIYTITYSSLAMDVSDNKKFLTALQSAVYAAAISVGIEARHISVVAGDAFALYFFSYLDNFAVLTVPIHSLMAPWEWGIFWHELAGYRIRQLKNDVTINKIKQRLQKFHERYKNDGDDKRQKRLEIITAYADYGLRRENKFARRYLQTLFSGEHPVLTDLGNIDYQFERTLENLQLKNQGMKDKDKFQEYEKIKADGWCVDWFEELFEDAFAVMAIREPFLDYFNDILSRHVSEDGRHPPLEVRRSVAAKLLELVNSEEEVGIPESIEDSTAQQILRFIALLSVISYQFFEKEEELRMMEGAEEMVNIERYSFPEGVGISIGSYIEHWSKKFLKSRKLVEPADISSGLSPVGNGGRGSISSFPTKPEEEEIKQSYQELLQGKGYKELLDLSFYERDFFSGNDITSVIRLVKKKVKGVDRWESKLLFSKVESNTIIDSLMGQGSSGELEFKVKGTSYRTTISNWNQKFPKQQDKGKNKTKSYFIKP